MDPSQVLVLLSLVQCLLAFAMGALAFGFGGQRLRTSRLLLSSSFGLLGVAGLAALLSFWLVSLGPQWVLTRTLTSVVAQSAAFLHILLLALSLSTAVLLRPLRRRQLWTGAAIAVGVAVAITLPGAFDPTAAELRSFLRIGVRGLLLGLGYLALAALVLRYRTASGRKLGQWLVVGSLAMLAAANLVNFGFIVLRVDGAAGNAGPWLSILGSLGVLMLAIALLVWAQERTLEMARARTESADRMAHFDSASGLPNRQGLLRRIDGGVGVDSPLVLLVVRLHRYAMLERTLGSAWTEAALHRLALALEGPRGDSLVGLGRIDNDRLALAMVADAGLADTRVLTRRRDAERAALDLGHPVALSFGYAVRQQREGAAELLASACLAQEHAESSGARMVRFEPEQARSDADEVQMVGALYRAIGEDQLFLEVQGIYRSEDGRLDSVEALLRWRHPVHGVVAPGRFLPAAERGGLMRDIDAWVLDRACRMLRERQVAGEPPIRLALNLSASSLLDGGLPALVESQLRRNQLDPHLLEIEVTESAAMHDLPTAARIVDELRELGVGVALDDLGTGYSSLSHLRDLRADRLKIDRGFIASEDRFSRAIAAAIGALGQSLGSAVVAEGVETEEQLAFCLEQRIGLVQGWLLHRPSVAWPPLQAPAFSRRERALGGAPL